MSMRLGLGQSGEVLDPKGVVGDDQVTAKDVTNLETEMRST